ncbi:MAG: hypothetical protein WCJ40_12590, partial [Planctomycetota bacterium]
ILNFKTKARAMAHGFHDLFAQVAKADDGLAKPLCMKQLELMKEKWLASHIDHTLGLGSRHVAQARGKPAGQDDDW